jgi:hypothetical protein
LPRPTYRIKKICVSSNMPESSATFPYETQELSSERKNEVD